MIQATLMSNSMLNLILRCSDIKVASLSIFSLSLPPLRGLMYGYTQTNFETVGSTAASVTGTAIPDSFKESIIPSLLFGSLISATDPGSRGYLPYYYTKTRS